MSHRASTLIVAVVLAIAVTISSAGVARAQQHAAAPAGFESVDVCQRVTGDEIASAVKGRSLDTRAVNIKAFPAARCVYGVEIDGARRTFVLWLNPAVDFAAIRQAAGKAAKPAAGIGDEAFLTYDQEGKRYSLVATRRDVVTIQVTGEEREWVQAIAALTLSRF